MAKKKTDPTKVESIRHKDKRTNIPTEELRDFVADDELTPKTMLYPRDPSLDPQLVWKGKDEQDREDLSVPVVPIYMSMLPAQYRQNQDFNFTFEGKSYPPPKGSCWKTTREGMQNMAIARRLQSSGNTLQQVLFADDYPVSRLTALWADTGGATDKSYVVQTSATAVERCILASTDPGDLVLDATCGSGTTAYVAEHWGRRWITCDTSRVALALARTRLMAAKYSYYLLSDSPEGIKSTVSRPFDKPESGKIAVKVINHYGDEVLKVFVI